MSIKEKNQIYVFGSSLNIKPEQLRKIPIIISDLDKIFCVIVEYIEHQKNFKKVSSFFERLIDAMVYEVYLPELVKSANCEILRLLTNLPPLVEGSDEATINANLQIIEMVQNELRDPKHPVSKAMDKMEAIKEIRIIEGKK